MLPPKPVAVRPWLRLLIAGSETLVADRFARMCACFEYVEVAGLVADWPTAQRSIDALRLDAVLIVVPRCGEGALALARSISSRERGLAIVLIAEDGSHAVAAFEMGATDYLLTSAAPARLRQTIARVAGVRTLASATHPAFLTEIWAPHGRELVRVGVDIVDWLEAERDYVRLHSRSRSFLCRTTLQRMERQLDPARFVRVHRSAIVSLNRISAIQRKPPGPWSVQLSSGAIVRVGRSFHSVIDTIAVGAG